MPIESDSQRRERHARIATMVASGFVLGAIGFAMLTRYRPELARELIPIEQLASSAELRPHAEESAALAGSAASIATSDSHPSVGAPPDSVTDSARQGGDTVTPRLFALLQDTAHRTRSPSRRSVITDVVLLPCSTVNPRPDGSVIIPPHNPRHRTVVGLPQKPGDPPRGFVIPPHDPTVENQVPIRIIPMDSILANTLRVPPHDPSAFSVVRPDSMACLPDSTEAKGP